MNRYRILSLDGGGTWALIQVKALIALYRESATGHEVLRDFDLAAANSAGSIVLACLLANFRLSDVLALFFEERQRRAIFSRSRHELYRLLEWTLHLGPKYDAAAKLTALEAVLGDAGAKLLGDAAAAIRPFGVGTALHVLITAFDYDRDRATFFRSARVKSPNWGDGAAARVTLAEAVHASANPPVNYFDAAAAFPEHEGRYWDGGVAGCNNPVLAAVTEAIGKGVDPMDVVALSLGTGSVALPWPTTAEERRSPYVGRRSKTGLFRDLGKLAHAVLDDPPDVATFLAHVMTGSGNGLDTPLATSRIVRMNPLVSPVRDPSTGVWKAPGSMKRDKFEALMNLELDAMEQEEVRSIARYADLWLHDRAMNQPIRMDANSLRCELGQETFGDAKAAWNGLTRPYSVAGRVAR